ncbi:MAG: co-chaperone GroES [Fusobacterium sp.]
MNIKPIGERILVEKLKKEEKTVSGIILAASAAGNNQNIMEIVSIGNGEKVSREFKIGDKIISSGYSGTTIKHDNKEYSILNFDDILGIVE